MDPAKAGWRISDLVAFDSSVAEAIAVISDVVTRSDDATVTVEIGAIRSELESLAERAVS